MDRARRIDLALFVAVGAAILALHRRLISLGPVLDLDDRMLLGWIQGISGPAEYLSLLASGRTIDVQPVRDLSYALDPSPHLTNVLIWLAGLAFALALLRTLSASALSARCLWVLLAFHPALVEPVAWISGRKHLLAFLFTAAATLVTVRGARAGRTRWTVWAGAPLLYAAAALSHPISLPWAAWFIAWIALLAPEEARRPGFRASALAVLGVAVAVGAANFFYYRDHYPALMGIAKFSQGGFRLPELFLGLGRYAFDLVLPLIPTFRHYPGAPWNLAGLALLPLLAWWTLKRVPGRPAGAWALLFALPLLLTTGTQLNVFVLDSYLLIPALAAAALAACAVPARAAGPRARAALWMGTALASAAFVAVSLPWYRAWESDDGIWLRSHEIEPTPGTSAQVAMIRLRAGDVEGAYAEALRLREWSPYHPTGAAIFARTTYYRKNATAAEKIRSLESERVRDSWTEYFLASLLASEGRWKEAYSVMKRIVPADLYYPGTRDAPETVAAETVFICRRAGAPDCENIKGAFMASVAGTIVPWNDDAYLKRLKELTER